MSLLKIFHRIDKSLNALDWKSIIERRTETAYRTVTLDAHDAPFRAEVNEIFLKFLLLGSHDEGNIHDRTRIRISDSAYKHL